MNIVGRLVAVSILLSPISANAGIITFDDRSAFESFVANFTVDNLDGIPRGYLPSGQDRGDYAFTMESYGCTELVDCGDNSVDGLLYPYIYTYGNGLFEFDVAVNAFGMDFGNNHFDRADAEVTLNGITGSTINGGFIGFVDTENFFSSVSYSSSLGRGSLFDNVTYGVAAVVPEPGTLALLGIGLAGIGLTGRKNKV